MPQPHLKLSQPLRKLNGNRRRLGFFTARPEQAPVEGQHIHFFLDKPSQINISGKSYHQFPNRIASQTEYLSFSKNKNKKIARLSKFQRLQAESWLKYFPARARILFPASSMSWLVRSTEQVSRMLGTIGCASASSR